MKDVFINVPGVGLIKESELRAFVHRNELVKRCAVRYDEKVDELNERLKPLCSRAFLRSGALSQKKWRDIASMRKLTEF